MKMDYQAPEVELITLAAEEAVATSDDNMEGGLDVTSNIFGGM